MIDFCEEFESIYCDCEIPWSKLYKHNILVTGATGLIGSTLVRALLYMNEKHELDCRIFVFVRDEMRASELFDSKVNIVKGSVESFLMIAEKMDYIIHGACPTASAYMVSNPVEVIKASILGTLNLIEKAKSDNATFLFLSSMEIYGEISEEHIVSEEKYGYVDPLVIRSCYPESKRSCEMIVASYAKEYGVNSKSIRLAQTFGPGIKYDDPRVFAMMARSVIEGNDIVLKTKGESKHPYLYVTDAVSAILTVLLKGEKGKSYNASNPMTHCSIYEMGLMVADKFGNGNITIRVEGNRQNIYPNTTFLNLDISRIRTLGWKPKYNLEEMYRKLIEYLIEQ